VAFRSKGDAAVARALISYVTLNTFQGTIMSLFTAVADAVAPSSFAANEEKGSCLELRDTHGEHITYWYHS
jgi:hypothetical protein